MRLMKREGKSLYYISKTLRRSTDTESKHVGTKKPLGQLKRFGRPPALTGVLWGSLGLLGGSVVSPWGLLGTPLGGPRVNISIITKENNQF